MAKKKPPERRLLVVCGRFELSTSSVWRKRSEPTELTDRWECDLVSQTTFARKRFLRKHNKSSLASLMLFCNLFCRKRVQKYKDFWNWQNFSSSWTSPPTVSTRATSNASSAFSTRWWMREIPSSSSSTTSRCLKPATTSSSSVPAAAPWAATSSLRVLPGRCQRVPLPSPAPTCRECEFTWVLHI